MPTLEDKVKWIDRDDRNTDPREFYRIHYNGLTRGQLERKDHALYVLLYRRNLLSDIPRLKAVNRKKWSVYGTNPVRYYKKHYLGLTRNQLQKESPGLYNRLLVDGLIDVVPTRSQNLYGNDLVAYYKKHYNKLTRGELYNLDKAFYDILRRKGLLRHVPTCQYRHMLKDGGKPVAYYKKHYKGLTRTQLFKKNPALYQKLRRRGLLYIVPRKNK